VADRLRNRLGGGSDAADLSGYIADHFAGAGSGGGRRLSGRRPAAILPIGGVMVAVSGLIGCGAPGLEAAE